METTSEHASQSLLAERRLQELAIHLPVPPEPFGTYTEAVQVGSLLFLSGTLPTEGRTAKFVGRVGAPGVWSRESSTWSPCRGGAHI